ncbi:MAG: hypothetical protein IJM78_03595 [Prevotella sp.]|nr:hypothetical protein [Prevotella sp.]
MKQNYLFKTLLLLLAIMGVTTVNAQSYDNEDFSVTWSMANGDISTGSASIEGVIAQDSWSKSSKINVNSTSAYGGNTITKFEPTADHNPRVERNADYYVEWTFTPAAGFTFTPTGVSFDAVKCGTGDPSIDVDFTDGAGVTEQLATNTAINRDGNGDPAINHSYTLTTANSASGNAVKLRIYIGKIKVGKQIAFGRVVITGKLNGSLQTYTTVYNLATAIAANGNIEGGTGSLDPTSADEAANAPQIQVDATSGKLGANGDWAQINENTVLTLPGVPAGATLTFVLYNTTALTINGAAYQNGDTYSPTKDENVVMTCTTSGYIKTITVEGPAFVEPIASDGYTHTWYFGKSNGAPEFALQGSAEYEYTVDEKSLIINTDKGKLNNASRTDQWSQCNNGTLFKIPVYAGSKLSWGRYATGSDAGFTVDGQLFNTSYIATEEGTVELTAKDISYLSYIKIEPVDLYEVTGTVTGGSVDGANMILTAAGNGQAYTAAIASSAFNAKVPADTYTFSLSNDVNYVVSAPESQLINAENNSVDITIIEAQPQTITGQITNAPAEAFTLTFTGASNTENVQCEAGATTYSVTLNPDTYTISSSVGTLSPLSQASFKVLKDAVTFNIYYPEAAVPAATQQEITVDKNATVAANVYNTVTDALAAAKAGNISAPVITLTSGQTYQEQVIVDMANVTLKTSGTEKATITWYYGIGYTYYSLGENGYYDKDRANTRNSIIMKDPQRWGATVLVTRNGTNFKAENIIFENSFNQRYTAEEVVDGVRPNGAQQITYDRTLTSGEAGYKAADAKDVTERAAAIGFENNPTGIQLYNCTFIGSQDTFYSSGTIYVKNCNIVGNTDYIFGGGFVVFDKCDLTIGGYSDKKTSAYITAYKDGTTLDANKKYVFRDCTVKKSDRQYILANFGRDWGGAASSVYFFNLKNEIGNALEYHWQDMSANGSISQGTADLHIYDFDPAINANYNTTGKTGANVNGVLTDEVALDVYANVIAKLGFTPERIYEDAVELDENSFYNICRIAASDNADRDVTVARTIGANKWNTLVVPFNMSEAQVKAAFGNNVKVANFKEGNAEEVVFQTASEIVANQPCMIFVEDDVQEFNATGVTFANAEPVQTIGDWQFAGSYQPENDIPVNAFFVANNEWQKAEDDTNKFRATRAYLNYNGASAAKISFRVIDGDEEIATGINSIDNGQSTIDNDAPAYNLAGQKVGKGYKGVMIQNGKKVVK